MINHAYRTKIVYVYVLREDGLDEVRYIGLSQSPEKRIRAHFGEREMTKNRESPKTAWIKSVMDRNGKIVHEIIDECNSTVGREREQFWINHYKSIGHELTNIRKAKLDRHDILERGREKYRARSASKKLTLNNTVKVLIVSTIECIM